jgi:hypothetical protein
MPTARRAGRFVSCVSAAALVVASVAKSDVARADEPVRPQRDTNPSEYPAPSTRPNLMLVGAAVAVGWYGAAVGSSYLWKQADSSPSLRIPVAGPYMSLGKTGCSSGESSCNTFTVIVRTVITSLSLVGQTGGLLAVLEGAFVPTASRLERPEHGAAPKRVTSHVAVAPTPMSAGGAGISVMGDF